MTTSSSRDEAEKVLKACPDAQWKLLFALSRYGGLRCPSEHLALTWGDIDLEAQPHDSAFAQDGTARRQGRAHHADSSLSSARTSRSLWMSS